MNFFIEMNKFFWSLYRICFRNKRKKRLKEVKEFAKEEIGFLSNSSKSKREKWVGEQWCIGKGILNPIITEGADPPDLLINGTENIEIVEVLAPERKKMDEVKKWSRDAKGLKYSFVINGFTKYNNIKNIKPISEKLILEQIRKKKEKYARNPGVKDFILVVYVNLSFANKFDWAKIKTSIKNEGFPFQQIDLLFSDNSIVRIETVV